MVWCGVCCAATAYHQLQDQVPRPMPLYQKHVDMYRLRLRADRKPHAAAIYDSEIKGDPSGSRTRESERESERDRDRDREREHVLAFHHTSSVCAACCA